MKKQFTLIELLVVIAIIAILPRSGRKIDLTADNGLDTMLLCRFVEIYNAEEIAMIGYRKRVHAKTLSPNN